MPRASMAVRFASSQQSPVEDEVRDILQKTFEPSKLQIIDTSGNVSYLAGC